METVSPIGKKDELVHARNCAVAKFGFIIPYKHMILITLFKSAKRTGTENLNKTPKS